jgi:hypothetical protein
MLKNPCNSTRFYSYTHDCIFQLICVSAKAGWPRIGLYGVSGQAFFSMSASHTREIFYKLMGYLQHDYPKCHSRLPCGSFASIGACRESFLEQFSAELHLEQKQKKDSESRKRPRE